MSDRVLLQAAFDAMTYGNTAEREAARLALRERLAQPEQSVAGYCKKIEDLIAERDSLRAALAQPEQEPFCFHDGRNIVGKEFADHSDVFPLYTSPNPEQQKPVRFNCTVIDDAHLNGVPLSQWGKQPEMQPCAGRNCGSTNPNLHSAECFEDYDKATGADSNRTWTQAHWTEYEHSIAAAEREACAKLVDHILKEGGGTWGDAIRARGQA